jgi:phosphoribosylformylglycinamidine synthase subunit PurS
VYKATVYVSLKENVLDPQGSAVQASLHALGFDEVRDVRVGKYMELLLNAASQSQAEERLKEMCEKLLVNLVIEDYHYELKEV